MSLRSVCSLKPHLLGLQTVVVSCGLVRTNVARGSLCLQMKYTTKTMAPLS